MQIITKKWLEKQKACQEGIDWFIQEVKGNNMAGDLLVDKLIRENKSGWANWLIVRVMSYKQRVSYAVFAAEQVIDIFEKQYPDDKRPRQAIEVAKKCIENPSKENRKAANAAVYVAASVAASVATNVTANAVANAADAATYAAYAAMFATNAAANAKNAASFATDAAFAAGAAIVIAYATASFMKKKILEYGLKLLKDEGI
jgi:hypothetical protein